MLSRKLCEASAIHGRRRRMTDPERILAIAPNWLGDAVMVTPALRAVHRRFPDAQLEVVGPGGVVALLNGLPWIHALHAMPVRAGWGTWRKHKDTLRHPRPDLALIFPHSFRGAAFARWSGARRRVGQARNARAWLLTDRVPAFRENGHIAPTYMVDEYLTLATAVGAEHDGLGPELRADPVAIRAVKELVGEGGPLVGIAPGAAWGPSKRWPAERYAAVADRLYQEYTARCVLLTGPGEEDTRAAVQRAARHPLLEIDDGRPTIATLKAAVSLLDVLVCNDSGPRHVAIAFGVPTVCIMGPTRPVYSTGPYERGALLRVDVDCGPCQRPTCRTDHRCMTGITPEVVADAARECLVSRRPQ